VLARTGHMSPLERPAELAAAIGELLVATGVTGARVSGGAETTQ
jgi:hypothetical protein